VSTTECANLSRTLGRALAAAWLGPARLLTPVVARPHDGTMVTARPNLRWGTDATATVRLADGQGTIFAALVSVRQGVRDPFGGMAAGVAGGRKMHHDHGSPYMRDDWHAELRCLGSVSSPAFVRQPEGNGSVERFFRTLKEQLFWVRHLTDVEALQQALRIFKATDHQPWVIERLGFRAHAGSMIF